MFQHTLWNSDSVVELPSETGGDYLLSNLQQKEKCQCHCVDTVTGRNASLLTQAHFV